MDANMRLSEVGEKKQGTERGQKRGNWGANAVLLSAAARSLLTDTHATHEANNSPVRSCSIVTESATDTR